jgi:hypothetical protein
MFRKNKSISSILWVLFFSLIFITMFSNFVCAQTVLLNQSPDQVSAYFDDPDYQQSVADNFILSSTATVSQIRIWGVYFPTNTPGTDNFTVIFHADSGALPGTVISTQNNVPVQRQLTGVAVGVNSYDEYVYTLILATPVTLSLGTYWVEIYNDVTGSNDVFAWETGTVDPTNGIAGFALAITVPGSNWRSFPAEDLSIEIISEHPTAIPTMNEWGMAVFVLLAGCGSVYLLKYRQAKG